MGLVPPATAAYHEPVLLARPPSTQRPCREDPMRRQLRGRRARHRHTNLPATGAEPVPWLPWLVFAPLLSEGGDRWPQSLSSSRRPTATRRR
jgi:hypothetical protein